MDIGGRDFKTIRKALLERQHYVALASMLRLYDHPFDMLNRYILRKGEYPLDIRLRTPTGKIQIRAHSYHDLLTVNEVFCRQDYFCPEDVTTVVDFGSNIGISALYFLTRNLSSRVKLVEPLPSNLEKLRETLRGYEHRYEIFPVAVGTEDRILDFGFESTGRYGGLEKSNLATIQVPCRNVNTLLQEIFSKDDFQQIDVLKIDIEGFESRVLQQIDPRFLVKIRRIFAEIEDPAPDLPGFRRERYGSVIRWSRISSV